jgi:hypothetical protein
MRAGEFFGRICQQMCVRTEHAIHLRRLLSLVSTLIAGWPSPPLPVHSSHNGAQQESLKGTFDIRQIRTLRRLCHQLLRSGVTRCLGWCCACLVGRKGACP